jgi:hypothetical protein
LLRNIPPVEGVIVDLLRPILLLVGLGIKIAGGCWLDVHAAGFEVALCVVSLFFRDSIWADSRNWGVGRH